MLDIGTDRRFLNHLKLTPLIGESHQKQPGLILGCSDYGHVPVNADFAIYASKPVLLSEPPEQLFVAPILQPRKT
jgi:hypothetical protein